MTGEVPRIIYSLWLQGLESAPEIVRLNFDRWERLNPGYRVKILDSAAVQRLVGYLPAKVNELAPQALSDVVRAYLLRATGGVWVDASVFPAIPLDDWLPSATGASGFFAFEKPGPDRPISSWFLAASQDNRMMQAWWLRIIRYWSVSRTLVEEIPDDPVAAVSTWPDRYPYFWFHYLFQVLLESDDDFAADWARCVKIAADPPHRLQARLGERQEIDPGELAAIAALAPVHKLNWRSPYPIDTLSTVGRA